MLIKDELAHHELLIQRFIEYRNEGYPELDDELKPFMELIDTDTDMIPVWSCVGHDDTSELHRLYMVFSVKNTSAILKFYKYIAKELAERKLLFSLFSFDLIQSYLVSPFAMEDDDDSEIGYITETLEFVLKPEYKAEVLEIMLNALAKVNRESNPSKYMQIDNVNAYQDPKPGDGWHEMLNYYLFVMAVTPEGIVITEPFTKGRNRVVDPGVTRTVSIDEYRKLVKGMYYKGSESEVDDLKFPGDVVRNQGQAKHILELYIKEVTVE